MLLISRPSTSTGELSSERLLRLARLARASFDEAAGSGHGSMLHECYRSGDELVSSTAHKRGLQGNQGREVR